MQGKRVSVLMPVYNAARHLRPAIESILRQTYTNLILQIIDDGSTDDSLRILQHYAAQDDRILLLSRANTGYVVALNEMLRQSTGDYIARMDADDVALPDRIEKQVRFLDEFLDTVCVGGALALIDDRSRLLRISVPPLGHEGIDSAHLKGHTAIAHPASMMRREALLAVGGYDEGACPAEDLDLWLRLGERGRLANLPDVVLRYRLHSGSVSERHCSLQRQRAAEACARAWARRGISGKFEASEPWRPGRDRRSQMKFLVTYGWWSFNSGERRTALVYGCKSILKAPWTLAGWHLLACALIKRMPHHQL